MIVRAYQSNPDLFSTQSVGELKNLFFTFEQRDSKTRLLVDLERYLTAEDEHFLATLMESSDDVFVVFSILHSGRLKISALREKIEYMLKNSHNPRITFHCLVSLGAYKSTESLPLVLQYLNSPDPATRRASIEAVGKIGTVGIIEPLMELYSAENDMGQRLAIIEAISWLSLSHSELVSSALRQFQSIESNTLLQSILGRELDKRRGN